MPQCRSCHYWNGPITERIDHSHCLHPVKNYKALRKSGINLACGHYEKKYYYKVVTIDNHSCSTKNMDQHNIYEDGSIVSAKPGTPGVMFFNSHQNAYKFMLTRPKNLCYKIKRIRPISKIINWEKMADKKRPPPYGSLCATKVKVLEDL